MQRARLGLSEDQQQTADILWVIITTGCHKVNESLYYHLSNNTEKINCSNITPVCQGRSDIIFIICLTGMLCTSILPVLPLSFLCKLTAEVWRESVREDSEGRQTATEPTEPAREPLGLPPLPSTLVALIKATWSKLCDR